MSLAEQGVRVLLAGREAGGDAIFLFRCGSGRGGFGCT